DAHPANCAEIPANTPSVASDQPTVLVVQDKAHIFSQAAVEKANSAITKIRQRFQFDVLIETHASLQDERLATLREADRSAFFERWAMERARANHINGVAIVVCLDPRRLQIYSDSTAKAAFSDRDRSELQQ